jgi:hypothetical protein
MAENHGKMRRPRIRNDMHKNLIFQGQQGKKRERARPDSNGRPADSKSDALSS